MDRIIAMMPLLGGWLLDLATGDPKRLPHPVVWFGNIISWFEKRLNRGMSRRIKGALTAIILVGAVYATAWLLLHALAPRRALQICIEGILIYYCLAGTTLIREVKCVFTACRRSLDDGRRQVARIVGRDTAALSDREVKTAAFETLAENLSDGVIAPLFWYALLGVPGMLAYKMVNTLDSMIGYRNERYAYFGCFAARLDDAANWIPARVTAALMVIATGRPGLFSFVARFGPEHASPNSGYPEAALAGALDCRFGGTHDYFGQPVYKPYIGVTDRPLTDADLHRAVRICRTAETLAVAIVLAIKAFV
ncbi:MAG: adenosylcobinamide-phosphate synthase CbiB [Candidatus Amulumruptor sp.]|nr:adenosylcobinamide-phosphate synthase CbiB [Candidatus Amulumruptor sp.]MDE7236372.1 adenosylcobinamide-phosphate synthase CbiB [Paramuribaculum sp.]